MRLESDSAEDSDMAYLPRGGPLARSAQLTPSPEVRDPWTVRHGVPLKIMFSYFFFNFVYLI